MSRRRGIMKLVCMILDLVQRDGSESVKPLYPNAFLIIILMIRIDYIQEQVWYRHVKVDASTKGRVRVRGISTP
jgi:hypothetical protein